MLTLGLRRVQGQVYRVVMGIHEGANKDRRVIFSGIAILVFVIITMWAGCAAFSSPSSPPGGHASPDSTMELAEPEEPTEEPVDPSETDAPEPVPTITLQGDPTRIPVPGPRVTITPPAVTVRPSPAPTVTKTITASPKPAPTVTVTKTVKPHPIIPVPTVTVTITVTATPEGDE